MKISGILAQKNLTVSFEIFPPKAHLSMTPAIETARSLSRLNPDFISVTYGAGGSTRAHTAEVASRIEGMNIPALAHLTCVGASREEILSVIGDLKKAGVENVLALRGDLLPGQKTIPGFSHASDLAPLLRAEGFCVGGACYPEGHPESRNRDEDIENLRQKVDGGCDFLTTQMFFDNDMLYSFLYRMQSKGIRVPVLAGIMPVTSAAQCQRMIALSNAYMPRKLMMIIDRFQDSPEALAQAGIAYAIDQIIDLISNGVRGIHIYTMNKSSHAEMITAAISSIIEAANAKTGGPRGIYGC
ncbi:MAG: methylenetetrahydrofolate reductase [NAD(P)H] [Spirochaetaceae bacterium]|jgi:methylenetetrahydrofolate reductase (NADPH)|nr:methylenetetrahydrofolate reductase [NAD(P)H] [Spirochaetaceae bacterium]